MVFLQYLFNDLGATLEQSSIWLLTGYVARLLRAVARYLRTHQSLAGSGALGGRPLSVHLLYRKTNTTTLVMP